MRVEANRRNVAGFNAQGRRDPSSAASRSRIQAPPGVTRSRCDNVCVALSPAVLIAMDEARSEAFKVVAADGQTKPMSRSAFVEKAIKRLLQDVGRKR